MSGEKTGIRRGETPANTAAEAAHSLFSSASGSIQVLRRSAGNLYYAASSINHIHLNRELAAELAKPEIHGDLSKLLSLNSSEAKAVLVRDDIQGDLEDAYMVEPGNVTGFIFNSGVRVGQVSFLFGYVVDKNGVKYYGDAVRFAFQVQHESTLDLGGAIFTFKDGLSALASRYQKSIFTIEGGAIPEKQKRAAVELLKAMCHVACEADDVSITASKSDLEKFDSLVMQYMQEPKVIKFIESIGKDQFAALFRYYESIKQGVVDRSHLDDVAAQYNEQLTEAQRRGCELNDKVLGLRDEIKALKAQLAENDKKAASQPTIAGAEAKGAGAAAEHGAKAAVDGDTRVITVKDLTDYINYINPNDTRPGKEALGLSCEKGALKGMGKLYPENDILDFLKSKLSDAAAQRAYDKLLAFKYGPPNTGVSEVEGAGTARAASAALGASA